MDKDKIYDILSKHKGKTIGSMVGLIFSVCVLVIGFFSTIFITLCILGGYYIGHKLDSKEDIKDILNRILPPSNRG